MSKVYMVKSSLVFWACQINITLLSILLMFNLLKTTVDFSVYDWYVIMLYISGVLFNLYVILEADRKWHVIVMRLRFCASNWDLIQQGTKSCLRRFLQTSPRFLYTVKRSLIEASESLPRRDFSVFSSPKQLADPIRTKPKEAVSRNIKKEKQNLSKMLEKEETKAVVKCLESTFKEDSKTPELNSTNLSKPVSRPKSDPVKKIARSKESIKAQSPELFKNKIYKSRMNLTTQAFPKIDLADK